MNDDAQVKLLSTATEMVWTAINSSILISIFVMAELFTRSDDLFDWKWIWMLLIGGSYIATRVLNMILSRLFSAFGGLAQEFKKAE